MKNRYGPAKVHFAKAFITKGLKPLISDENLPKNEQLLTQYCVPTNQVHTSSK